MANLMSSIEALRRYTLDLFLEEATRHVEKEKRRAYCSILIMYPDVFEKMPLILDYYGKRKRSHWIVNIHPCAEKDFYLVTFVPKEQIPTEKPLVFFWKTMRDEKYVMILSFSLHSHVDIRRSLDSLVGFVKGLWFAWLGSRFLEKFDLFAKRFLGEDIEILASFQTAIEKGKFRPRKMRIWPLPPREFIPLEDVRKATREAYVRDGEILTFSSMRYRIVSTKRDIQFTFSITDRSKIMFERGDFTVFVTLLRPLLVEIRRRLDVLRRKFYTTDREATLFGKSIRIRSFDLIETLVFKRPKETEEWHSKVVELLGADIPEEKLVNFTLLSGNPYFLVHVVDVENSSSAYLSATSDEIQISPAENYVKEGTIAKILELLRSKVDPSISIS